MREGRLESILHSELFIHQHNLQSFEERRDVQAFHPEMFALHCKTRCAMSVRVCLCVCVDMRLQNQLCQSSKASGSVEPPKNQTALHKIRQTEIHFSLRKAWQA